MAHRVPRQCLQTVERATHVGRLSIQEYSNLPFREKHYPRTTCSSTPPPRSSRISSFEPLSFSDPRSTKPEVEAGVGATRTGLSTTARAIALPRFIRQRWNNFGLTPSPSQNASSVNPLCANRATIARRVSALRRFVVCIALSSDFELELHCAPTPNTKSTPRSYRLLWRNDASKALIDVRQKGAAGRKRI